MYLCGIKRTIMKDFKNILCPIDFSGFSDAAVEFATNLAKEGSTIHLCHTIHPPLTIDPYGYQLVDIKTEELKESVGKLLREKVDAIQEKFPNLQFDSYLDINGDTGSGIVEVAKELDADLIVIASHGRKGLKRLLMGSVAESVMRDATCPVVMIRPQ
jgi:universal stress protein A